MLSVDLIQERYGWQDEYVLDQLPVERVLDLIKLISNKKQEESRERYQLSAFTVWQSGNTKHDKFKDYLIQLGLYEDKNNEFISAEDSLKKAEEILKQAFKK